MLFLTGLATFLIIGGLVILVNKGIKYIERHEEKKQDTTDS